MKMFYALGFDEGAMIPMAMETHAVIAAMDRQTWSRTPEPRTGWGPQTESGSWRLLGRGSG